MLEFDILLNAFVTLFVTIDPIGLAPMFLGLTEGMNRRQRLSVALRANLIALFLLVLFLIAGSTILSTMGITIHAFRVAGGLLLFYIAFEMVFGVREERKRKSGETAVTQDRIANLSVFPLALPLIAGPGAFSATILLASEQSGSIEWRLILFVIIVAILTLVFLAFAAAQFIDRYLGITGRMILTRLLGVLLAALSVQFVVDGLNALIQ
ncbi:MAG: MarC family protein [Pseudomonadota bacterium]